MRHRPASRGAPIAATGLGFLDRCVCTCVEAPHVLMCLCGSTWINVLCIYICDVYICVMYIHDPCPYVDQSIVLAGIICQKCSGLGRYEVCLQCEPCARLTDMQLQMGISWPCAIRCPDLALSTVNVYMPSASDVCNICGHPYTGSVTRWSRLWRALSGAPADSLSATSSRISWDRWGSVHGF